MADLVSVIIGPVSLLVGIGVSEFRQWRQEKEKYRTITFEKRLTVHQEAYSFSSEMGSVFFDALTGHGLPIEKDLASKISNLRKWWRENCLWLDMASRRVLLNLANSAEVYLESYDSDDAKQSLELAKKANKTITEGIGEKYLPEVPVKKQPKDRTT